MSTANTIDVLLIVIGSLLQLGAIALRTTVGVLNVTSYRIARFIVILGLLLVVAAGLHALPRALEVENSH